jgi:hypothetical protein
MEKNDHGLLRAQDMIRSYHLVPSVTILHSKMLTKFGLLFELTGHSTAEYRSLLNLFTVRPDSSPFDHHIGRRRGLRNACRDLFS